jgi:predicted GNAT family acetyltransferase
MSESLELQVNNNKLLSRFEVNMEGRSAFLQYVLGKDTISLTHTYTPEALRGRGIASAVVKVALDYAKENKLKVIIGCSFVGEYINLHPEYKPLVS